MKVNGQPADPGCYIEGSWGQYGPDRVADVAEQFGIEIEPVDDPRELRLQADNAEAEGPTGESDKLWDRHVWAADDIEQRLNMVTEGGYWMWTDGEFFLTQTEVERIVYVAVDDGEDYDDAWRHLVEGDADLVTHYDDLDHGQRAYTFRITVHYEPEGGLTEWTDNEIARGLDN